MVVLVVVVFGAFVVGVAVICTSVSLGELPTTPASVVPVDASDFEDSEQLTEIKLAKTRATNTKGVFIKQVSHSFIMS